jgi:hypothetical protein
MPIDEPQEQVDQAVKNWLVACHLYSRAQLHLHQKIGLDMGEIDPEALSHLVDLARDKEVAFWEMMRADAMREKARKAKANDERARTMGGIPASP